MKYISLILLALCCSTYASAKTVRVRIYFRPWSSVSSSAVRADEIMRNPSVRTDYIDRTEADVFIRLLELRLSHMKKGNSPVRDIRLVIKADQDDGTTRTFFASRFEIEDNETGAIWQIDDTFRNRFDFRDADQG